MTVQDIPAIIMRINQKEYISLTDMVKTRSNATRASDVIKNWMRSCITLEFLDTWKMIYNHTFTLSIREWISKINAIGM